MKTPVLLVTFNRPAHTRRSLKAILTACPRDLYVFQDGARDKNESDKVKCIEVRQVISELVKGTNVVLHTYYSERNLGCGLGPASAISWFFSLEEQGIIIEDDCLLAPSGFLFYESLLMRFKDDQDISAITATNLHLKWRSGKGPYLFATVGAGTLGCWATWARAWKVFDYQIKAWRTKEGKETLRNSFAMKSYYDYYSDIFDKCDEKQTHMWDYQWFFAKILHHTLTVVASQNMVSNIGFDAEGTHTCVYSRLANLTQYSVPMPLDEVCKKRDALFDWVVFQRYYYPKKKSFLKKIMLKLIDFLFQR